jgi:hypothetical protein
MSADRKTGGCQCGALRFETSAPLQSVYVCHCRMCQKSVGGPFAVFTMLPRESFRWTRGQPAEWASSSLGFRQFCHRCGTPVGYRFRVGEESKSQYLTGGVFDDFRAIQPNAQWGLESKHPWLSSLSAIPVRELDAGNPASPFFGLANHQHPDREMDSWTPHPPGE